MSMPSTTLTFPHAELTPISGTPHNTSLKLLTKEIYANARAIPSTRGGGGHGHLGLVMPVAEYVVVAGVAFQLPAHPGPIPTHAAGANAATRQENIRLFDATIKELSVATTVQEEIKKQLLGAINRLYLAALDDDTFGFADVTVAAMITHLRTNYGPIMRAELETNRASIATIWTPDDPIETLWERLREIQRISVIGGDALTDNAIKDLTFLMFEATGVFTTACDTWRVRPLATQTLIEFREHFTSENKERLRKLTTSQAGFHSAHAAFIKTPTMPMVATPKPAGPTPNVPAQSTSTRPIVTNDGLNMYYCWTHGLGFNRNHTSGTCSNPAEGHRTSATVKNMQNGNNTIMSNRRRLPTQE